MRLQTHPLELGKSGGEGFRLLGGGARLRTNLLDAFATGLRVPPAIYAALTVPVRGGKSGFGQNLPSGIPRMYDGRGSGEFAVQIIRRPAFRPDGARNQGLRR